MQEELSFLRAQRSAAEAHATLMALQNESLRRQIDELKRPKTKRINVFKNARFLTPAGGTEVARQLLEDEKQKKELLAQKAAQQAEIVRTRAILAASRVFEGTLASYQRRKKEESHILAMALRLDVPEKMKKEDIYQKIVLHLALHPELAEDSRFTSLFAQRNR